VHELRGLAGVEDLRVRGRAAVGRVDGDRGERLAGAQQHAGPDLADVVAALLVDALRAQLVDPVADHLRRLAVEDVAGVDDRAGLAVEVLAVERTLGRVVGDRDRPDLFDVRRVAHVEELHAAVGRHRGHTLRHADGVEGARDRQHAAVGRHLLVLPRDVDLHPAERLGRRGIGDVVDRDVLAGGDEQAVADHLRAGGEADVLLDRAQVLDVLRHHRVLDRDGGSGGGEGKDRDAGRQERAK
jgi:hypothetical protein